MAKLLLVGEAAVVGRVRSRTAIRLGRIVLAIEVRSERDPSEPRELEKQSAVGRELLETSGKLGAAVWGETGNLRVEPDSRVGVRVFDRSRAVEIDNRKHAH